MKDEKLLEESGLPDFHELRKGFQPAPNPTGRLPVSTVKSPAWANLSVNHTD